MICPNPKCHQVLPDKAIICPYCGTRLNQKKYAPRKKLQTAAPPQPPARKKWPLLLLTAAAVLVLAFVLGRNSGPAVAPVAADSAPAASVAEAASVQPESAAQAAPASAPEETPASTPEEIPASTPEEIPASEALDSNESYQQIFVEASGSSAQLSLLTYRNGEWVTDLTATAAIGSRGITYNKTEGDHMTPAGTFPLVFAFSSTEQDTKMPFVKINENSVWVCDPNSSFYNTLQSQTNPTRDWSDSKSSVEKMYVKFSKQSSSACLYFAFNGDGQTQYSAENYNGGSALFLDGVGANGNLYSGYGDIKISAGDMKKLLKLLDPALNPTITIEPA